MTAELIVELELIDEGELQQDQCHAMSLSTSATYSGEKVEKTD